MRTLVSIKQLKSEALALEKKGDFKGAALLLVKIGKIFYKREKLAQAFEFYEKAVIFSPSTSKLYLYLALIDFRRGSLTESKQWLNQFCKNSLQQEKFFSLEEFVSEKLKKFPELLRYYYEFWLTLDRTQVKPFVQIALSFASLEKQNESIRWFLEALKTKDKPLYALKNFKEVLEKFQRTDLLKYLDQFLGEKLSLEDFLVIVKNEPRAQPRAEPESSLLKPLAKEPEFLEMIEAFEREFDMAEDPLDKISPLLKEFRQKSEKMLSQDDRARLDLALGFYEMELFQVAQEELNKINEESKLFFEAQNLLTEILIQQGLLLKALESLKKMIRQSDLPISIRLDSEYKIGWVYYRLGDREKAMFWLDKVGEIDPTYRDLSQLRMKLKASE